jgi:quercetin dioxygenase-like cupin family protein
MALNIPADEIQDGTIEVDTAEGGLSTRAVYGNEVSMVVATRAPGYHSVPHRHHIEQLTYVASGETWMFIGEDGFIARQGDFFRVPSNEVHWSWNTGGEPLVTFQCFSPVLDPSTNDGSVGLFADGETPEVRNPGANVTPDDAGRYRDLEPGIMGDKAYAAAGHE